MNLMQGVPCSMQERAVIATGHGMLAAYTQTAGLTALPEMPGFSLPRGQPLPKGPRHLNLCQAPSCCQAPCETCTGWQCCKNIATAAYL